MLAQFRNCLEPSHSSAGSKHRLMSWAELCFTLLFLLFPYSVATAQAPPKKNVLIISEAGLSHTMPVRQVQQIIDGVEKPGRQVEFYSENLDLLTMPAGPSLTELKNWLIRKYSHQNLDVIIAIGPETIRFLAENSQTMFPGIPVVVSGSSAAQIGRLKLNSRFTGTWARRDPVKTLESAFRLFPDARQVYVVGGSSEFDQTLMELTKAELGSYLSPASISYLSDLTMSDLLGRVRNLPERSVVLYLSFFADSAGERFVNATGALPMVAAASNAPIFGMSDTYLGRGIVGGKVISFDNQAELDARIVSDLLDGKKAENIPIDTLPSIYMFDWKELQRWQIPEKRLPPESIVLFHEQGFWERTKGVWIGVFVIILSLSALALYLQRSRKQLELAKERQMWLSGMLINAEEQERSRVANELHDDFSQRLAVLALKLGNTAEVVAPLSKEADRQLHELLNTASELGADLHTLSHHLHSSTLEKLGLVPGIRALCKEFSAHTGLEVKFSPEHIPATASQDVALCIFRLVQESLRNVKKHSGAGSVEVTLQLHRDMLRLSVCDEGNGFEIQELQNQNGLGIHIMEERVRLLGGVFKIHSAWGKGTSVEASLPIAAKVRIATARG